MEAYENLSAFVTPTEKLKFKFPPDVCTSVDRLRDISNFQPSSRYMRRSFTPNRNSLYLKTPDISPIEFNTSFGNDFKRAPPEMVQKVDADSTVTDETVLTVNLAATENSNNDEEIFLKPPPPGKRSIKSRARNENSVNDSTKQQKSPDQFSIDFNPLSKRKFFWMPSLNRKSNRKERVKSGDVFNVPISLSLQLGEAGLTEFREIFEKEEIDLDTFFTMSEDDFHRIGINNSADIKLLKNFRKDFFEN